MLLVIYFKESVNRAPVRFLASNIERIGLSSSDYITIVPTGPNTPSFRYYDVKEIRFEQEN